MSKGPGRTHRKGITLMELADMFPDEDSARRWFEDLIWPEGKRVCPRCHSSDTHEAAATSGLPYYRSGCKRAFSVRIGTVLERSKVPLRKWVFAIYLEMTNLKGISSMKLHRDIGVTQRTAWFMLHRIREAWDAERETLLAGPVEADETYVGGRLRNMHAAQRRIACTRTDYGKTIVAGVRDRATGAVRGQVVERAEQGTLTGFVRAHAAPRATVYTDEAKAYAALPNHETVNHGRGEYVRGGVSTNGVESFWALLKRGFRGTYHHWSPKHTQHYVNEFAGRLNLRNLDTADQMATLVLGMVGKRLRYR